MNVVYFLYGTLVGMFFVLFIAYISILAERRKNKKYQKLKDRSIQFQVDRILSHQPSDEEIIKMFSDIIEAKGEDYSKMFENCEGNKEGGEE